MMIDELEQRMSRGLSVSDTHIHIHVTQEKTHKQPHLASAVIWALLRTNAFLFQAATALPTHVALPRRQRFLFFVNLKVSPICSLFLGLGSWVVVLTRPPQTPWSVPKVRRSHAPGFNVLVALLWLSCEIFSGQGVEPSSRRIPRPHEVFEVLPQFVSLDPYLSCNSSRNFFNSSSFSLNFLRRLSPRTNATLFFRLCCLEFSFPRQERALSSPALHFLSLCSFYATCVSCICSLSPIPNSTLEISFHLPCAAARAHCS